MNEHVSTIEARERESTFSISVGGVLEGVGPTLGQALISAGRSLEQKRKGKKRTPQEVTGLVMNIRAGSNEIHKVPAPRGACHSDKIAPEYALKRPLSDLDELMKEPRANLCWFCFGIDSKQ